MIRKTLLLLALAVLLLLNTPHSWAVILHGGASVVVSGCDQALDFNQACNSANLAVLGL